MPGSEPPVGAAVRNDELPAGYFAADAEKVRDRAAGGNGRAFRFRTWVEMRRAEAHGRTNVHTGKCWKWSCKPTGREEHGDSNHKMSRDDGNEYGRTGMCTGRAGKGPVSLPAGGAAIGSKLGLLLQRNIYAGFVRLYFKYPYHPSSDRGTKSEQPCGLEL